MNIKTFITAVVVSVASLGAVDLMGVPVSANAFAQTDHKAALVTIMTSNKDNPGALLVALRNYLVNNPDSVSLLGDAVTLANPGPGSLSMVGKAARQAYGQLSRAGNPVAASALFTEMKTSLASVTYDTTTTTFFSGTTLPNCVSVSCS